MEIPDIKRFRVGSQVCGRLKIFGAVDLLQAPELARLLRNWGLT